MNYTALYRVVINVHRFVNKLFVWKLSSEAHLYEILYYHHWHFNSFTHHIILIISCRAIPMDSRRAVDPVGTWVLGHQLACSPPPATTPTTPHWLPMGEYLLFYNSLTSTWRALTRVPLRDSILFVIYESQIWRSLSTQGRSFAQQCVLL